MKITVKVNGRSFIVEVGDLHARPVVAMVDGERFEVWPEDLQRMEMASPAGELAVSHRDARGTNGVETPGETSASRTSAAERVEAREASSTTVKSPLPGVIESVAVEPGAQVNPGDTLCVIEAMKMKNTIRASRAGTIKAIKVAVGQHVRHGDALMEYTV